MNDPRDFNPNYDKKAFDRAHSQRPGVDKGVFHGLFSVIMIYAIVGLIGFAIYKIFFG